MERRQQIVRKLCEIEYEQHKSERLIHWFDVRAKLSSIFLQRFQWEQWQYTGLMGKAKVKKYHKI